MSPLSFLILGTWFFSYFLVNLGKVWIILLIFSKSRFLFCWFSSIVVLFLLLVFIISFLLLILNFISSFFFHYLNIEGYVNDSKSLFFCNIGLYRIKFTSKYCFSCILLSVGILLFLFISGIFNLP